MPHEITRSGLNGLKKKMKTLEQELKDVINSIDQSFEGESTLEDVAHLRLIERKLQLEDEIHDLVSIIENAKIIRKRTAKQISIGSVVKLVNHQICHIFQIVEKVEANPTLGKVSDESPLGSKLLGKQVGEIIMVPTPNGQLEFSIVAVR